ncbi:SDR family oxidoreductase [Alphaproteobacteria bacterium]|nr:SDR family oxidoreductase [Alphaproteobacteria bacterium]MDC1023101.1 SDR family oxidoreductase [Alphaproteobacteria bacterium]
MIVLVLGASGMIGSTLVNTLSQNQKLNVYGTIKKDNIKVQSSIYNKVNLINNINFKETEKLEKLFDEVKPDFVINCIGLIKSSKSGSNPMEVIPINSLFPHNVSKLCHIYKSKFIHISTDCVFSGLVGDYEETSNPDPVDLYGKSKLLGEPINDNDLIIRTSLVGHEINSKNGLLEWFLSQKNMCDGYENAIFSGFTSLGFANVIDKILSNYYELSGLYHISSTPISKLDFLNKIAWRYEKNINIIKKEMPKVNRSLNASLFDKKTGIKTDEWDTMIENMFLKKDLYV